MRAALALALLSAVTATSALAGASQSVTFSLVRVFDQPTQSNKLKFSGTISSGAAGEEVTVMQQVCGYSFATAVAGTQTRSGGAWDAEPATPMIIASSATFHARWKNVKSEPVTLRPGIPVFLVPVGKGRVQFRTTPGNVYQDMRGRIVLLERFRNNRWTTVRRQKLAVDRVLFSGYVTTFVVPRGWTVRARITAKSAAPCFKQNATDKVRVT